MWYTIFSILLLAYMAYGIVHVVKNKSLNRAQKAVWIIIAIMLPTIGVALYLRSTFKAREW